MTLRPSIVTAAMPLYPNEIDRLGDELHEHITGTFRYLATRLWRKPFTKEHSRKLVQDYSEQLRTAGHEQYFQAYDNTIERQATEEFCKSRYGSVILSILGSVLLKLAIEYIIKWIIDRRQET